MPTFQQILAPFRERLSRCRAGEVGSEIGSYQVKLYLVELATDRYPVEFGWQAFARALNLITAARRRRPDLPETPPIPVSSTPCAALAMLREWCMVPAKRNEPPPVPLSPSEQEVWDILEGQALLAKELAMRVPAAPVSEDSIRKRIAAIRKTRRDIRHRSGLGYYRQDAPPPN